MPSPTLPPNTPRTHFGAAKLKSTKTKINVLKEWFGFAFFSTICYYLFLCVRFVIVCFPWDPILSSFFFFLSVFSSSPPAPGQQSAVAVERAEDLSPLQLAGRGVLAIHWFFKPTPRARAWCPSLWGRGRIFPKEGVLPFCRAKARSEGRRTADWPHHLGWEISWS